MNQLRVAHIGWLASSHLERRATEIARRGVATLVITDQVPAHLQDSALPFEVEVLPVSLRHQPEALVAWLEKRLTRFRADLLHVHSTHFPASLGLFVRSVPRLTSIWDFVHARDSISPLYHKVILDELRKGKLSEAVSFSSPVVFKEWLSHGFPGNRGFWHSWGVNLDNFSEQRNAEDILALRDELGIAKDHKIIFSPRTPSLPANIDILLQALPHIDEPEKVVCIITGHAIPPEARYLEGLLRQKEIKNRVRFIKTIRDQKSLSLYYQMADLIVSLHSNDHNPATVLEAMAVGGQILINESPTVEYWLQDGRNGLVVRTRDLTHLIAQLNKGLRLEQKTKINWRQINRSKIESEANFHKTVDQILRDYRHIPRMNSLPPCSAFHKGLLADICSQEDTAAELYRQATPEDDASQYLKPLIEEKAFLQDPGREIFSFHQRRAEQHILQLAKMPQDSWKKQIAELCYPMSLFRHDIIAGFYPFLIQKQYDDLQLVIKLLAARFQTDTLEWLAECCQWFGTRWQLWEECAGLLLTVEQGGTPLGCHALQTAKELGNISPKYRALLAKARDWTKHPIRHISHDLDKKYRQDVQDESVSLLDLLDEAAA